ncbi:retrovirus-related pol polyprotein from transposon TNT 1-94 [Tanacetum coccineum]
MDSSSDKKQVIARDELLVPTAKKSQLKIQPNGIFYRENVDYPSLIWEDIAYQIDHRREKKSRRENMPYPRYTKVIIDYFLSKHKSLKKLKFQHFHTIKDDGVVSRLKFVRMGEDVQQYGLAIPATMLNNEIIQSESYKRFIMYSTGQIPPKKSRGKGSQGKKSTDPTEESVDVSDESEPEPLIRRKTSSRRVAKKKATISVDDNIVPEPDIALELGKSISLTEAEEEAAARQVHATHARIVSESVPKPARRRRSDIVIFENQKLKEQDWYWLGSDEGTGKIPKVPDESIFADAEDDNEETESDSDDIYKYRINVRKNADTKMKDAEKTADITKETTEQPLTSSSFSVPSDYGNQFLNLSHNEEIFEQPLVLQQTTPIPTTITTPPINTEAPAITTAIPEITPFITLQLRVAKLEQHMSEVKKFDQFADVLASILVVDKYIGTKLDDALLKTLERHTADLVEKYSVLPAPEEQEEKKQEPTYTIKSTDKAALEEFDLKSALFKSMHKNKSANRNPANYRLYHALMEALIEDENAMDKEVADMVKDHKRKHDGDDNDDDDDKGPPAGSNQCKSSKKRRTRESDSAKTHPPQESFKGKRSKGGFYKLHTGYNNMVQTYWRRKLASPEPELVHSPIDLPEADNNWANAFAKAHQDPDENKLHNKIDDIGSFIRWYCRRIGKEELSKADLEGPAFMMVKGFHENNISLQFQMEECHKLLTTYPRFTKVIIDYFLSKLKSLKKLKFQHFHTIKDDGDVSQLKVVKIELVLSLWIESEREYDISAAYGIKHRWFTRKQFYINKHSEPSDRDAVRSHMRILSVISIKTYERYGYNYLREIVLRRADYNEYKILEKDFKSLHPNDFEDLNILHIQGKLDHLPKQNKVHLHNAISLWTKNIVIRKRVEDLQLGIESYQTKLNLEQPNWDVSNFPFKEDYTIVFKPRAVIYRDRDDNRKMMRINEVHKFSDGTLTRIKEKLDFMVKDFKLFKFNKGMENRKWTEDDKRRSEDFIEDTLPILLSFTHCGNKSILRVLRIILVILPEHPSETKVFHNEDGNPARANIKQALGRWRWNGKYTVPEISSNNRMHRPTTYTMKLSYKDLRKVYQRFPANSDIVYFFTSHKMAITLQDDSKYVLEYEIGPETQEEAIKTAERAEQEMMGSGSEICEQEMMCSADKYDNRGTTGQAPLDAVPLNYVSPVKEMMHRGKRVLTETNRMKSPFYVRVVNVDKDKNSDEKKFDVLFETKYGQISSREQIETLGLQEPVDNNVLSSWSAYLNFLEGKKDKNSPARIKKVLGDNDQTTKMFMVYVKNAHSTYGGLTKLDKADIVFTPVSNNEHKFLLCFNMKNPAVSVIDNKKEVKKVATRKKKKVEDIDDMRVASILHKHFGQYLLVLNHGKAAEIIKSQLVCGTFDWQTDKRVKDCGIFVMRHMETYMGNELGKWKCGLDAEGKKQNTQLGRLRNKYAAKLLLSDCNIYKSKIHEEMDRMKSEVFNVKAIKVPQRGK